MMRRVGKIRILLLAFLLGGSVAAKITVDATPGTALAFITIKWPQQMDPEALKVASIRLEVRTGEELLEITAVNRPLGSSVTNTVINNLPAGDLIISAVACSEPNGHGDFDMSAVTLVRAQNRSTLYIGFTTTGAVEKIDLSSLQSTIFVGSSLRLYTTPRDAEGDIVLTRSGGFVWKTSDHKVVAVDDSGLVMGLTGGSVRITLTDVTSGKFGSMELSVLSSGRIEGEAVWEGEIILTGDVAVGPNGKLSIRPGTSLLFRPFFDSEMGGVDPQRIELVVEKGGTLDADGGWPGSIVFTTSQKGYAGGWYGLRIFSDNVTLKNCTIENATVGLTVDTNNLSLEQVEITCCSENGVSIAPNRNVYLKMVSLNFNRTGIIVYKGGTLRIDETVITNSYNRALSAEEAMVTMDRSKVVANQDGVFGRKSELSIGKSTIANNGNHGIHAIECSLTTNANRITDNGIGLRLEKTDGQLVKACKISGNRIGIQVENQEQTVMGKGNQLRENLNYELLINGKNDVIADGIFWGQPTTDELANGVGNLEKVFDCHDSPTVGRVIINQWENELEEEIITESLLSSNDPVVHDHNSSAYPGEEHEDNDTAQQSNEAYEDESKSKQKYFIKSQEEQKQEEQSQSQ